LELRQEYGKFKANMGYIEILCLKKQHFPQKRQRKKKRNRKKMTEYVVYSTQWNTTQSKKNETLHFAATCTEMKNISSVKEARHRKSNTRNSHSNVETVKSNL
jgi:hypothetical protein